MLKHCLEFGTSATPLFTPGDAAAVDFCKWVGQIRDGRKLAERGELRFWAIRVRIFLAVHNGISAAINPNWGAKDKK